MSYYAELCFGNWLQSIAQLVFKFAENDSQSNARLLHGQNIFIYGESWCGPGKAEIPTAYEQRNGSLRMRLLGLWNKDVLCKSSCLNPIFFLSCNNVHLIEFESTSIIVNSICIVGLGRMCWLCRSVLLWFKSTCQSNRRKTCSRKTTARTYILSKYYFTLNKPEGNETK